MQGIKPASCKAHLPRKGAVLTFSGIASTSWRAGEGFKLEGGVPAKAGVPTTATASDSTGVSDVLAFLISYYLPLALECSVAMTCCMYWLSKDQQSTKDSDIRAALSAVLRPVRISPLLQDTPSSNGLSKPEAEQPHHASAQPDAAVPKEAEVATQEHSHTPEQHSLQGQQEALGEVPGSTQTGEDALDEQLAAAAAEPANDPDRSMAEQAAKATLEALNVGAAHPMNIDGEHAPSSSLPEETQMPLAEQSTKESLAAPNPDSPRHAGTNTAETGGEHPVPGGM